MLQRIATWLRERLLILQWMPEYTSERLRGDVTAGLTVGTMMIPQGMAYAVIAGVPPIYGLYAGLVPLLVYPIFGSSRQLAVGPVALDMLIVAAGVGALAETGTDRYVALAILMTALVGVLQIGMGLLRLGFLASLLSRPVISGLTSAASIIIACSQLGNLLGIELGRSQYVHVLIWEAVQRIGETHGLTLGLSLGFIGMLVGLARWAPAVPGPLVVVAVGTAASWFFGLGGQRVALVRSIPTGLPTPQLWDAGLSELNALFPAAVTLALMQFMKDASLGRIFAKRHDYDLNPNQELLGVGAGNVVGSLFQGIPASGSFSRSAVNDQSGAQTPLANAFAAAVIALTLLFLTPLFYYLPVPALAAIIVVSGLGLIDLRELRALFRTRRREGYIALFTAGCTLLIGVQEGILLGIGASVLAVLFRISRPNVAELGHVPGTRRFRDLDRFEQATRLEDILILRVDASYSFANADYFRDFLLEQSQREGREVSVVIVDGSSINALDATAVEALYSVANRMEEAGIEMHLTGLIGPVRERVRRSGLHERVGANRFHLDPHAAVVQVLARWDEQDDESRLDRYLTTTDRDKKASTPTAS
ncbi:MAG: sodium-independent anion transporter [Bacteroidetes bacterium SW_9_63_38]|nr:MAG: sodium-independent anion transporter [Bacteroidetes bacterium SW_9_63_38]